MSDEPAYAGLVTRAIAIAVDAAIINVAAATVAAVVALTLSIFNVPDHTQKILAVVAGGLWVLWIVGYFVTFWSTTGQTPGNRLMQIRVRQAHADQPIPVRRGIVRLIGMLLAAIPLLAGYALVLVNRRRRGFHDWLARTVVVHVEPEPVPARPSARR